MSDIVTIGLHRSTLKALAALDAHTFADGRPVYSTQLRDALLSALIIEIGRNEDEWTIRHALDIDNGATLTQDVLEDSGIHMTKEVIAELDYCGMKR